jgi:DNA repair ATPase RecN
MALERVVIQNFQSLKKLDLELGKFTVIEGASSSGKSAFMRAIKALASGIRGSSFITVGAKSASITAYTENDIITLEKSKTKGRYLIANRSTGEEEVYTKLASAVPEDVSKALRLQPITKENSSLNFAGQHDMPFLLKDSPSQVAKVLGDLTKVSTIFEAVKTANKKKLSANALLKVRQDDLDLLLQQAQTFKGLVGRKAAVEGAEEALERLSELQGRRDRLETLVASLETSEALVTNYQELPTVPSAAKLEELHSSYQLLRQRVLTWLQAKQPIQQYASELEELTWVVKEAHEAVHAKLQELGTCPTCGGNIND